MACAASSWACAWWGLLVAHQSPDSPRRLACVPPRHQRHNPRRRGSAGVAGLECDDECRRTCSMLWAGSWLRRRRGRRRAASRGRRRRSSGRSRGRGSGGAIRPGHSGRARLPVGRGWRRSRRRGCRPRKWNRRAGSTRARSCLCSCRRCGVPRGERRCTSRSPPAARSRSLAA
jgi:hypothetical protein